jgi:NADH-quinone oxidoreductase subunit N
VTLTQPVDLLVLASPVLLALGALLVLVVDLVLPGRQRVAAALSLLVVVVAGLALLPLRTGDRSTFCVPPVRSAGTACAYVADDLALVVQLVLLAGGAVVLLMSLAERRLPPGEYHFLLLVSLSGGVTVAAARDLATLVIALEVVSLSTFALVALRRDTAAAEAALTAFLVSVVATAVTVMGIAFVYAGTGSLLLGQIRVALADPAAQQPLVQAGVVMVLAAPAFKLAAVPFHAWAPDTYLGAPLPVAAYLSVVSKGAGLVALLSITLLGFGPMASTWAPAVAVLTALTMVVGNLGALRQRSLVRLLAWSSVAQAGYLLLPVAAGGDQGLHALAASASVAYLAAYAAMNLGAFAVVTAVAGDRSPWSLHLDTLRGLARSSPGLGLPMAFFLACLAGLPPGIVGLVVKVRVLEAPVRGGSAWLALLAAAATVVGLAYYLRLAVLLFLPVPDEALEAAPRRPAVVPAGPAGAVAVTLVATVVLSVAPALVVGLLTGG